MLEKTGRRPHEDTPTGGLMLSDQTIKKLIDDGEITISGFTEKDLQAASVELHLAGQLRTFDETPSRIVDVEEGTNVPTTEVDIGPEGYLLLPGDFVLGSTMEIISLPDYIVGRIEGKSTLGRVALAIHATAGFIDPGFNGDLTLEISNLARHIIRLRPGMKIGQMALMMMDKPARRPYGHPELGSHYQNQRGPTNARLSGQP